MLSQRKKLQTSSQSRRKNKYMLPLSKPKLVVESTTFRNISTEADRSFGAFISKPNFSLKSLNTHRPHQNQSYRPRQDNKIDLRRLRGFNLRQEKSKVEIVLCIQSKEIQLSINANTVGDLTRQIRKYLKFNRYSSNIKTVESVEENLAINYLLSVEDIPTSGLIHQRTKIRPYYGCSQTQINLQSFQVIRTIGSGGFSTVYLARFKGNGKFYAMKVLSKAFISKHKKQRLVINQKNVMKLIDHPYLTKLHWSFQSKNFLIFVMDYYPGGELFGVLKKYKRMSQGMARYYITEILLGLEELHSKGIAYRDLKPQNILLDKNGHACISDFGLVKPGLNEPHSKAYSFCGSPEYMPPQVIARKGHSLCADFYSLGALLFQLLTGLPPFYHRDPEEIYKGTLNGSLSVPSFLTENAKDLLLKLLCKSETNRLGAKNGVQEILGHSWFGRVDKERFLQKKVVPPISFSSIEDLSFNSVEMKKSNSQCIKIMLKQQTENESFHHMLSDFKFNRNSNEQEEMKENFEQNVQFIRTNHHHLIRKESLKLSMSSDKLRRLDNFF